MFNYCSFTHLLLTALLRIECTFTRKFRREYQLEKRTVGTIAAGAGNSNSSDPRDLDVVKSALDQEISTLVATLAARCLAAWFGGESEPLSWYRELVSSTCSPGREPGVISSSSSAMVVHHNKAPTTTSSSFSHTGRLLSLADCRLFSSPAALWSLDYSGQKVWSQHLYEEAGKVPNHILSLTLSSLKQLNAFDLRRGRAGGRDSEVVVQPYATSNNNTTTKTTKVGLLPGHKNQEVLSKIKENEDQHQPFVSSTYFASVLPIYSLKVFGLSFFSAPNEEAFVLDATRSFTKESNRAKPHKQYVRLFLPLAFPKFLFKKFFQHGGFDLQRELLKIKALVGVDLLTPMGKIFQWDSMHRK